MHNAQCYIGETTLSFLSPETQRPLVQFSLPLSKSVRARELVLDALAGKIVEVDVENDDIFVLSRALNQCTMHNAQCTIFAISENNQTCLDCRAEQKSQPKGVIFAISENNQACLDCRAEQKSQPKGVIFAISEDNQICLDCRAEQKSRQKEVMHNAQLSDNSQLFIARGSKTFGSTFNSQLSTFNSQLSTFNLNASGTALRFLTAYCAVSEGVFLLTGSDRLCERPIKPLVDALRGMGASIEYVEKEGFAPLRIKGQKLKGGRVRLDASLSSQFASALMLISDKVEGGVEIEYEGDVASQSYISLTKGVIEKYKSGVRYSGERDWSSATVWYAAMAVLRKGRFLLEGLSLDSCQPDRAIVEVFEKLGVSTMAVENGLVIESNDCVVDKLVLDCKNMPDAVMYIVVVACLLGVDFEISGVETLRVKESDRIEALMNEMRKCGYHIQCTTHNAQCTIFAISESNQACLDCRAEQKSRQEGVIFAISEDNQACLDCREEQKSRQEGVMHNAQCITHNAQCIMHSAQCTDLVKIETYDDHRMAMAMSVVGLVMDVEIENPEVVNKSYPEFWEEFNKIRS